MDFTAEKDEGTIPFVLSQILDTCVNGITLSDPDQPEIDRIREAVREQKPVTVTLRNYRKDGTLFHNRFSIRPLFDRQGRLVYYLGIQYDVTESIRAKEELSRLNAQLAAMGESPD